MGKRSEVFIPFLILKKDLDSDDDDDEAADVEKLSREKVSYNTQQKALRARVEDTFGQMETMFSLNKPWQGESKQLDDIVFLAAGILNNKK
jgi:hypothetical protein